MSQPVRSHTNSLQRDLHLRNHPKLGSRRSLKHLLPLLHLLLLLLELQLLLGLLLLLLQLGLNLLHVLPWTSCEELSGFTRVMCTSTYVFACLCLCPYVSARVHQTVQHPQKSGIYHWRYSPSSTTSICAGAFGLLYSVATTCSVTMRRITELVGGILNRLMDLQAGA